MSHLEFDYFHQPAWKESFPLSARTHMASCSEMILYRGISGGLPHVFFLSELKKHVTVHLAAVDFRFHWKNTFWQNFCHHACILRFWAAPLAEHFSVKGLRFSNSSVSSRLHPKWTMVLLSFTGTHMERPQQTYISFFSLKLTTGSHTTLPRRNLVAWYHGYCSPHSSIK